MKKPNSITLMLMGIGLLPIALLMDNLYLKSILSVGSIVLNITAVIQSFKEKKEKENKNK